MRLTCITFCKWRIMSRNYKYKPILIYFFATDRIFAVFGWLTDFVQASKMLRYLHLYWPTRMMLVLTRYMKEYYSKLLEGNLLQIFTLCKVLLKINSTRSSVEIKQHFHFLMATHSCWFCELVSVKPPLPLSTKIT